MSDAKILVVDDVTSMRNVTKSILTVADYTNVTLATDGDNALELLNQEPYDLRLGNAQHERARIINKNKKK